MEDKAGNRTVKDKQQNSPLISWPTQVNWARPSRCHPRNVRPSDLPPGPASPTVPSLGERLHHAAFPCWRRATGRSLGPRPPTPAANSACALGGSLPGCTLIGRLRGWGKAPRRAWCRGERGSRAPICAPRARPAGHVAEARPGARVCGSRTLVAPAAAWVLGVAGLVHGTAFR